MADTSGSDATLPEIVHEPDVPRFAAHVDGHEAQVTYRLRDQTMVIDHTEVPDELGGQGLAGRLVESAVAHAAAAGLTVAPWCPYARRWLERHPDAAATVTVDWSPPGAAS